MNRRKKSVGQPTVDPRQSAAHCVRLNEHDALALDRRFAIVQADQPSRCAGDSRPDQGSSNNWEDGEQQCDTTNMGLPMTCTGNNGTEQDYPQSRQAIRIQRAAAADVDVQEPNSVLEALKEWVDAFNNLFERPAVGQGPDNNSSRQNPQHQDANERNPNQSINGGSNVLTPNKRKRAGDECDSNCVEQQDHDTFYSDEELRFIDDTRAFVIPSTSHIEEIRIDAVSGMRSTSGNMLACCVCELDFQQTDIALVSLTPSLLTVSEVVKWKTVCFMLTNCAAGCLECSK
jgi:hypothetical protein